MKTCIKCLKTLENDNFYGKDTRCKKCHREYSQTYRVANRARILASKKIYNASHRDQKRDFDATFIQRCKDWQRSAERRHIPWLLDFKDLEALPRICFYTGQELTLKQHQANTISLERLDSSLGYTKENVVFCRADINVFKGSISVEKFLEICRSVYLHKTKATTF